jgi:hypothetical protein
VSKISFADSSTAITMAECGEFPFFPLVLTVEDDPSADPGPYRTSGGRTIISSPIWGIYPSSSHLWMVKGDGGAAAAGFPCEVGIGEAMCCDRRDAFSSSCSS